MYGTESDDTITGPSSTVGELPRAVRVATTPSRAAPATATGNDYLDGGAGIDAVDYGANTASTTVNLAQNIGAPRSRTSTRPLHGRAGPAPTCGAYVRPLRGSVTSGVGGESDVLINIENAILGTGNDTFTGSAFNNTVWPNGGQNTLNGCPTCCPAPAAGSTR